MNKRASWNSEFFLARHIGWADSYHLVQEQFTDFNV
jgi:hypothetical protein